MKININFLQVSLVVLSGVLAYMGFDDWYIPLIVVFFIY
jgi:hypothetical protein